MAAAVRTSPMDNSLGQASNKRKRGNEDIGRNLKDTKPSVLADDDVFQASLLQSIDDESQRAAQAALAEGVSYPDTAYDPSTSLPDFGNTEPPSSMNIAQQHSIYSGPPPPQAGTADAPKPGIGSKEWNQQRKDSHKEVERRRREVINEGIENIAKIVPGTEKNKGAILQRTAQYIGELQEKEAKFDSERQLLKITIEELTKRNESLQASTRQAWNESNKWQERCRNLGGDFDDYDSHGPQFDETTDLDATVPA